MNDQDIEKYLDLIKKTKSAPSAEGNTAVPSSSPTFGNPRIDPSCDIRGIDRMQIGKDVVIQRDCWLNIAFQNPVPGPMIVINEGTNIGRRCTLSAANKIYIGRFVLLAPNVFIADTHHEYQNITIPIMHQGITTKTDRISIGDESWIGINTVIMGNVSIGRHCVIGANAVVTKDIPDYCVAVGNPAKIIKIFNMKTRQWVRVNASTDTEATLAVQDKKTLTDNPQR